MNSSLRLKELAGDLARGRGTLPSINSTELLKCLLAAH